MNYSQQLLPKLFSSCLNIHIFKEQIPSETNLFKEFHFQTFSSISVDFYIVSFLLIYYIIYKVQNMAYLCEDLLFYSGTEIKRIEEYIS